MNRPIFLFVIIGLIIAGVLLLWDSPRNPLEQTLSPDTIVEQPPEAQATTATSSYFDESGRLSYTFRAKRLRHFAAQERPTLLQNSARLLSSFTNIDQPLLTFYNEDSLWHISADQALVRESGKLMLFENNVVLWQQDIAPNRTETPVIEPASENNVKLNTESLTIEPDLRIAYTEEAVTIASPLGKVDAIGMQADMFDRKIKLKNSVKGNYQGNLR